MSDTLVITPTYNEKENIENIIRKVFSLEKEFDMLIVEDNSPDGTADIVKRLMQEFPERLFIKERKGKLGLGTAYLDGFRWGLEHGYEYMIEMDATAGFVCYSRKVLEKMKFDKVKFVGYAFQIEMKYTATRLGFRLYEVPIVFTDRVLGTSKMSMKIFKEAFFGVFNLRFRNWKNY